jgi:plastocyanin
MIQSAQIGSRTVRYLICSLWLAVSLGGCGKPEVKPTGTVLVSMADNSYSPAIIHVPVGGSIVFINAGRNDHNAIAVDKSWSSEQTFGNIKMKPEDMSEIVLSKEGVYPFYCSFHATPDGKAGMVGVVVVGNVEYTACGPRWRRPRALRAACRRNTRPFKMEWMRRIPATWC